MSGAVLSVRNLTVSYTPAVPVLSRLTFDVARGETLGLTGPSGCGKSTTALAVMGMLKHSGAAAEGEVLYDGRNLLPLSERELRRVRWREIAMVPQSSMNALNPVFTVRRTLYETIRTHLGRISAPELERRCEELLEMARLDKSVLSSYPHELSGGMRQRVSIALSLALSPRLLILDEATTGLDVIVEADILYTIRKIKEERELSLIFITHDKRLQSAFCDRQVAL